MKKIILILSILLSAFSFSSVAQTEKQNLFKGVVSLQVLCTLGGPEGLMEKLLESYNEKPVHALDISTISGLNVQMYITENKNNPTSTIILANPNLNMSCIFMTAKDTLLGTEAESLPAKQPEESGPKIGV